MVHAIFHWHAVWHVVVGIGWFYSDAFTRGREQSLAENVGLLIALPNR